MSTNGSPVVRYVDAKEAAEILGTSTKTVRRRIKDGTIPAYKIGRLVRIRIVDLHAIGTTANAS